MLKKPTSTPRYSAGSSRLRKDLSPGEAAYYVYLSGKVPYWYWSAVRKELIPWICGDDIAAYRTEEGAEVAAFGVVALKPWLIGKIGVMRGI